ncbi:GntR family transcriptional regulator [Streptomyces sp. NPDC048643]|uniref:GntR family transcriptional regulator n=1 Tax=Streptomyces sp. NPDC048643 TaxID=3155637 RepID=UPI003446DA20
MGDLDDSRPKWVQIFEILSARIADGTYAPDTRIPTTLELQGEFGVANATAQKVYRRLREDGLIRTEPGMGSYVKRQA